MSKLLFKKAFYDMFSNRRKAVLALIAIIVGMIAFGTLMFSYEIITNEIVTTYSSINPASANIGVDRIDERFIELTDNFKGIEEYEIKAQYQMRGKKADNELTTVELFASENFQNLNMNKIFYMEGDIAPKENEMLIERDALKVAGKQIGDILTITLPNGKEINLKISGIINDLGVHPATMHNTIYAYVSMETLRNMELTSNRIDFKITDSPYNRENILAVSNEYMHILEQNNYQIKGLSVDNTPGVSMHLEEYKTALSLLRTFAFIAFLFGCLIISSLITSILSQQIKQIGILKSFGTKSTNIIISYLTALLVLIMAAGLVSLPLSKVMANSLSALLLRISNMSLTHTQVNPLLYVFFLFLCFSTPLIVAFFSIKKATKITIKDAISNSNIVSNLSAKPLFTGFSWLQRPVLLTLRNAFCKKGRFYLNVSTLAITGTCFISIFVSMFSVSATLKNNLNTLEYDYHFISGSNTELIEKVFHENSKIEHYEYWGYASGKYLNKDGQIENSYPITAIPENSSMIFPDILNGKWLQADDSNEVVVSHEFLENHPNVNLGDSIDFSIDGTILNVNIIGVIKDFSGSNIYMSEKFMINNIANRQEIIQVQFDSSLRGRSRTNFIQEIEEQLVNQGISITQSETKANAIKILNSHYMATFQTFLIIIFMVLIVSAFGLSSTAHIQTLERMKEIGIMKSMGANKKLIVKIITSESIFIGICGWIISALISIPSLAIALSYFSAVTLQSPIEVNWIALSSSYIIWFLLSTYIGKRASKRSALMATKMTIKETLLFHI